MRLKQPLSKVKSDKVVMISSKNFKQLTVLNNQEQVDAAKNNLSLYQP